MDMAMNDPRLMAIGKELIDYQALEVRIRMLEREFSATDPNDTMMVYLLQVELENAYKSYLMHHRNLINIRLPIEAEILMTD